MKQEFVPTPEMIKAAEDLFVAMAKQQLIEPVVTAYKVQILKEGNWNIAAKWAERLGQQVILDPNNAYLLEPADFSTYDIKCRKARDAANLVVDADDKCPLLVANTRLMEAERRLCDVMEPISNLSHHRLLCSGMPKLKEAVELYLQLLSPFVRTGAQLAADNAYAE